MSHHRLMCNHTSTNPRPPRAPCAERDHASVRDLIYLTTFGIFTFGKLFTRFRVRYILHFIFEKYIYSKAQEV